MSLLSVNLLAISNSFIVTHLASKSTESSFYPRFIHNGYNHISDLYHSKIVSPRKTSIDLVECHKVSFSFFLFFVFFIEILNNHFSNITGFWVKWIYTLFSHSRLLQGLPMPPYFQTLFPEHFTGCLHMTAHLLDTTRIHYGHGKDVDLTHKKWSIGHDMARYVTHYEVSVHHNCKYMWTMYMYEILLAVWMGLWFYI